MEATQGNELATRVQSMLSAGMVAMPNPYSDHGGIAVEREGMPVGYVEYNGQAWDAERAGEEGETFPTLTEAVRYILTRPTAVGLVTEPTHDDGHEHVWTDGGSMGDVCRVCGLTPPEGERVHTIKFTPDHNRYETVTRRVSAPSERAAVERFCEAWGIGFVSVHLYDATEDGARVWAATRTTGKPWGTLTVS